MIKTILVPATASDADSSVFASAATVARAFGAHLDFLHVRFDTTELAAAMISEDAAPATARGLFDQLEEEADQREQRAEQSFRELCQRERIQISGTPANFSAPSAQWHRETGSEAGWIADYGRSADLLILGRPPARSAVSSALLEAALLECGRPLFIPGETPVAAFPETIAIAWKETPEAARALAAAMPFLAKAKRITILLVEEEPERTAEEEPRIANNLRWHGFQVSVRRLKPGAKTAPETLLAAARDDATLLVMGGYGHSRLREWIFGGFTRRVLSNAPLPVLMMH
jgi:nucleotide-binding universal stress UspA family protein